MNTVKAPMSLKYSELIARGLRVISMTHMQCINHNCNIKYQARGCRIDTVDPSYTYVQIQTLSTITVVQLNYRISGMGCTLTGIRNIGLSIINVQFSTRVPRADNWNKYQIGINEILQLTLQHVFSQIHYPRGDLIKKHHKAQPPHEVSTKFHCSHQMILQSPSTCKNPLKSPQKESNYLSTTNFSGGLVKPPFFSGFFQIFTMQNSLSKTPLLVDFGQVPPWDMLQQKLIQWYGIIDRPLSDIYNSLHHLHDEHFHVEKICTSYNVDTS